MASEPSGDVLSATTMSTAMQLFTKMELSSHLVHSHIFIQVNQELSTVFKPGKNNRALAEIFTSAAEITEQVWSEMLPMNQYQVFLQISSWHRMPTAKVSISIPRTQRIYTSNDMLTDASKVSQLTRWFIITFSWS